MPVFPWRCRPRLGRCSTSARAACATALFLTSSVEIVHAAPSIQVTPALRLVGEPRNENLATLNQAMNPWANADGLGGEYVVALIHQFNNMDRRADDRQYAVVWSSDGEKLTERHRIPMSCPDVELVVPNRGPYVYEARLDLQPGSLHSECSCQAAPGRPCPAGAMAMRVDVNGNGSVTSEFELKSLVESHFVSLENEWRELIADRAVLGRIRVDVEAFVAPVTQPVENRSPAADSSEPFMACPGSYDEIIGGPDVTSQQLVAQGVKLPDGHVRDKWCLVQRGGCSDTAKVKVCELSGAVGTIIMDHGNFENDQEILIRYSRAAKEAATKPVLFISEADGQALMTDALPADHGVKVKVGPSVAGTPPPGYTVGSGLIVHRVGNYSSGDVSNLAMEKRYPDLFATAGWIEVSDIRDVMFVCIPNGKQIRIYDVSDPLQDIPLMSIIDRPCARSGRHDYRVLDYRDVDGSFATLLVDPANAGNRLYYYKTQNISRPVLWYELHANWEAEDDGLGQVRPGGINGKWHIVSWHCSNLYCGKNHGDSLYMLNTEQLTAMAQQVPLPMLSPGGFVRDLVCGEDGVCMVSLTWDGLVAVDSGAVGSKNAFGVIAEFTGNYPFSTANIPYHMAHLRLYSGAQKVYNSQTYNRHFYIEHADFSLRPLQVGDVIRALQLKEVYIAKIVDYDPTVAITGAVPQIKPTDAQRDASVAFSLTLEGLDHSILSATPALMDTFTSVIRETIAGQSGAGMLPDHVALVLAVGSVIVYVTIMPPETMSAVDVQSLLAGSMDTLGQQIAAQVRSMTGIDRATTGTIAVASVSHPVLQVTDKVENDDLPDGSGTGGGGRGRGGDGRGSESEIPISSAVVLLAILAIALILLSVLAALLIKSWRARQHQEKEITQLRQVQIGGGAEGTGVVVGRAVNYTEGDGDVSTGNPVSVVNAATKGQSADEPTKGQGGDEAPKVA